MRGMAIVGGLSTTRSKTTRYSLSCSESCRAKRLNSASGNNLEITNYGDKVIIRKKSNVTIKPYEVDQKLAVERPISATVELTIDKGQYFNEVLDDVMEVQADLNLLSMWADEASIVH